MTHQREASIASNRASIIPDFEINALVHSCGPKPYEPIQHASYLLVALI